MSFRLNSLLMTNFSFSCNQDSFEWIFLRERPNICCFSLSCHTLKTPWTKNQPRYLHPRLLEKICDLLSYYSSSCSVHSVLVLVVDSDRASYLPAGGPHAAAERPHTGAHPAGRFSPGRPASVSQLLGILQVLQLFPQILSLLFLPPLRLSRVRNT